MSTKVLIGFGLTIWLFCSCSSSSSETAAQSNDASVSYPNIDGAIDASASDQGAQADVSHLKAAPHSLCGVVPSNFACKPFNPLLDLLRGSSACNNDDVRKYIHDCWDSATATSQLCLGWGPNSEQGMTECGVCLSMWVTLDGSPASSKCYYLFMGADSHQSECRDAYKCANQCAEAACSSTVCDVTVRDESGKTEYERCLETVIEPNGLCATITVNGGPAGATLNSEACLESADYQAKVANCHITDSRPEPLITQIEGFFRGACRDNANWSKALNP